MDTILLAISNGTKILEPLYWVFGKCMAFLLNMLNDNYFVSLIIFTLVTRIILLPFNVKQQKTMAKTSRIQPKIAKIQKKYPDPKDRMKMNEEMQALYAREGHNPMNMGCGPMVFQMVFLMGVIGIIYYPLQYIIGIPIRDLADQIAKAINYDGRYFQLDIVANWAQYKTVLVDQFGQYFTPDKVKAIEVYREGFNVFGIDLTQIPTWKGGVIVLVPIFSFLTSLASTLCSTLIQKKNNPAMQQQSSMLIMMLMMPFFSLYIAFQVTAGVGVYWIISNVVAILQQLFIAKFYPPRKSQAKLMIENTIERRSREDTIKKIK